MTGALRRRKRPRASHTDAITTTRKPVLYPKDDSEYAN